ncbi:peptidoglycan editing factor PgeF [Peptacetobacter sp.]|uniref:peptidoglycan editing factor PgeF n=1 Tax=Peptacetobacter sp. TaxID=2991975 RepID=UPI002635A72C|nr:peptidoglycan editing factor PgeF [Peptacetobacter sp.]
MKNCLEEKIKFEKNGFAKIIITTREFDAKNINDLKKISSIYNLNFENITNSNQIHSDIIRIITNDNVGKVENGDAMITNLANTPLIIYTADCVPIVLIDKNKKVVANIHAGWRGTYSKIVEKTIKSMLNKFGSNIDDIHCIIGPAIGPCCYEVSKELVDKFNTIITNNDCKFYIMKEDKFYIDLTEVNTYLLKKCGIKKENINNLRICTSCQNDSFYSYRKDNKTDKRIGTIVEINL